MKALAYYSVTVSNDGESLRGVPIRVTERWLKDVREVMRKRDWTRADLARAAGTSAATITRLFDNDTSTVMVSRVAAATGLPDPSEQLTDDELQRWMYAGMRYRQMDQRKFRMVLDTMMTTVGADDALRDVFQLLPPVPMTSK